MTSATPMNRHMPKQGDITWMRAMAARSGAQDLDEVDADLNAKLDAEMAGMRFSSR